MAWLFQNLENKVKDTLSPISFDYPSWVDNSNSAVLRYRNNKQVLLFALLHPAQRKTQKGNIYFIMSVFIYMRKFTQAEKLFRQEPNN